MKNEEEKDLEYWSENIKTQKDVEEFSKHIESLIPKFSSVAEKIKYVIERDVISRSLLQRIFGIGYPSAAKIVDNIIVAGGAESESSMGGCKVISKDILKELLQQHFNK